MNITKYNHVFPSWHMMKKPPSPSCNPCYKELCPLLYHHLKPHLQPSCNISSLMLAFTSTTSYPHTPPSAYTSPPLPMQSTSPLTFAQCAPGQSKETERERERERGGGGSGRGRGRGREGGERRRERVRERPF